MIEWRTDFENAPREGQVLVTDGETAAVVEWSDWALRLWGCGWTDIGDIGWGGMEGVQPTHWAYCNLPGQDVF